MLLSPVPPDMVPLLLVVATPRFKSATNTTLINSSTLGGSNEAVTANASLGTIISLDLYLSLMS